MDRNRDKMAESMINLTLEILFWLTGEDYIVVKKTSSERCQDPVSEGWGRTLSPIMGPPSHPLIHEEINREKILELTNKMIELLTGEVPIRCQDVAVYFSMEEWEYLEGHKDLYKDVMMEDHRPLTPPVKEERRTPERCPSPLLRQDESEEHHNVPQNAQVDGDKDIMMESHLPLKSPVKEERITPERCHSPFLPKDGSEKHHNVQQNDQLVNPGEDRNNINPTETYVRGDEQSTEDIPTDNRPDDCTRSPNRHRISPVFKVEDYGTIQVTDQKTVPSAFESNNQSLDLSQCGLPFDSSQTVKPKKEHGRGEHHTTCTGEKPFSCLECGKCFTQDLLEGMEEERAPPVSTPVTSLPTGAGGCSHRTPAPSQTQASARGQRRQVRGSKFLIPPLLDLWFDNAGDEEKDAEEWVPPPLSGDSSTDEEGRYPRKMVRQVTREPNGRDSTGNGGRRRQQVPPPPVRTEPEQAQASTTQSDRRFGRKSPVWAYFNLAEDDHTIAICQLCHVRVRRGRSVARLGTTALTQHLRGNHWRVWDQMKGGRSSASSSEQGTAAPATVLHPPHPFPTMQSHSPTPSPGGTGSGSQTSAPSTAVQRQPSVADACECTVAYAPEDRRVRSLNGLLARVIAQHLLPFNIVDCNPFRQMLEQAQPRWHVPSRHFFARTAVPALHQHIVQNVSLSLDHAVSNRVHLTMDAWTSRHGQGRYLSFTAHWVSLRGAGEGSTDVAASQLVVPPRGVQGRTVTLPQATVSTTAEPPSKRPRSYTSVGHVRCQAMLQLVSLGEQGHTGPDVLAALQAQVHKWLTPRRLQVGTVICDDGSNLLAAVHAGSLPHVPCIAHVLNLVVQKFLRTYPSLSDIVQRVRRIASHFRHSPTATATLSKLQQDNSLPPHRLMLDSVTRWNSTLHMLERLWEQRRVVKEYLQDLGTPGSSHPLPYITNEEWGQIYQVCHVLAPFEQATKLVSGEHVGLNDVLPIVFLLDRTLERLLDAGESALVEQEDTTLLHQDQEEECFEEVVDVQESGSDQEGELVPGVPLVRGWDDSQRQQEEDRDLMITGSQEESQRAVLFPMAAHMLHCLRRDPWIRQMKERDDFWVATLLDPRCKGKLEQFLPASQQDARMKQLRASLLRRLEEANPLPNAPVLPTRLTQQVAGSSRAGDLMGEMRQFYQPARPSSSSSHHQRLASMVADYMGSVGASDSMSTDDPMEYWVARLDTCRELAQYALEVLSCPPSSVLSEQTFSAAGGVVTDKRTLLSTDSMDRLTFIKMNGSWISGDFLAPAISSGRFVF